MPIAEELRAALNLDADSVEARVLSPQARGRLDKLADFCPVYRNFLKRYPTFWLWLETDKNRDFAFRPATLRDVWNTSFPESQSTDAATRRRGLQRFRRAMCLRIAYREINALADITNSLAELTYLAEFVLEIIVSETLLEWESRLGVPWDETYGRRARFCVIGLGKLGGAELNFCSDLDLIYLYQGQGHCCKDGSPTAVTNDEFFTRVCRDITNRLQENTDEGFLYHIDLRLRPEGNSGPIVRALSAMESYYAAAGQTWERLALMKARPVAGNIELGHEFFESINSFRHPILPPPSLIEEIIGLKLRTEREILGNDNLERNIKTGTGGIREIEFLIQALQISHCGKNPFLQTPETRSAIQALERYGYLEESRASQYDADYRFLRTVEHRLQMREERQTHSLPVEPAQRDELANCLGYENVDDFEHELTTVRARVHAQFNAFFQDRDLDRRVQDWTLFFSGKPAEPAVKTKLRGWFWGDLAPVEKRLRQFILGGSLHNVLTREQVVLFLEIADQFDTVLPPLAHPMNTLERLNSFAERYGARKQFLRMCAHQPNFFKALCLLFDRSRFIHDLLSKHPEIMDEIFLVGLRRLKPLPVMLDELERLPNGDDATFAKYLWLYVKAEQVRIAIVGLLAEDDPAQVEPCLSDLADAVLVHTLRRVDPNGELAVIALGKHGGRETVFGSDLDLIFLGPEQGDDEQQGRQIRRLLKIIGIQQAGSHAFDVDLRLRPHGNAGPLVVTNSAFERYHVGTAQLWERQLLTRARPVAGNEQLLHRFVEIRDDTIFNRPLPDGALEEIYRMRQKITQEKVRVSPPERAFKAAPGGIIDVEFFVQVRQLIDGHKHENIRVSNTRRALEELHKAQLLGLEDFTALRNHYTFLRNLEQNLRRDLNRPVTEISADPDEHVSIAKWLGFSDYAAFWKRHVDGMRSCRDRLAGLLPALKS